MAEDKISFPYVVGTQKLANLIKKIPDIGIPDKFTLKTLKSLGFTSSNDERFVPAIKFIGLLNPSGEPTDLWKEARAHLGRAIAKGTQLTTFLISTNHSVMYLSLLDLAAECEREIVELEPQDRIDVQSFIWVVGDYPDPTVPQ